MCLQHCEHIKEISGCFGVAPERKIVWIAICILTTNIVKVKRVVWDRYDGAGIGEAQENK